MLSFRYFVFSLFHLFVFLHGVISFFVFWHGVISPRKDQKTPCEKTKSRHAKRRQIESFKMSFRLAFFRPFALKFRPFAWRFSSFLMALFHLFAWRFFRLFVFSHGVFFVFSRGVFSPRKDEMAQSSHRIIQLLFSTIALFAHEQSYYVALFVGFHRKERVQ